MPSDIRDRILDQDEADWLYETHPGLGRSFTTYCPTCRKKGTYRWQGQEHPCDCQEQLQLHKWYLASGIGTTYQRLAWDDAEGVPQEVIAGLVDYTENIDAYLIRGIGVLLVGGFGTGKTMCANLMLKPLVRRGYTCWATTFAQMLDLQTETKANKAWFRRKFISSDVLLIDDIGKEMRTKAASMLSEATFDNIVRQRVRDGRATFVTSNLTPAELAEGYGGAVLSLLVEKSILFEFPGEDFRQKANRRELAEIKAGEIRPIT